MRAGVTPGLPATLGKNREDDKMVARKLTEKEKKVFWEEKRKEILAEHPRAFITMIEVINETDEDGKPVYGKIVYHKPIPTGRRT
jgi:hypothetical protein